ncbi:gag-pol polyprotein [Cucumis melo var. makuwa]|uniref:Gag-pol polyprotein n=1 Tax=Cucumis melo var. makuwa TaxID=1194695 RepID=A0A5D3CBT9_CUCMM|nr:gag-pol polyprotein [Cucumis melo var. makuwa]TYK08975.1 gag-pol polyprotein [Cucumis melo var. makuwa]
MWTCFGDGAKGRIVAKGNIKKKNLPYLNDVRYVEGLKVNLISVNQLCDQGYTINFSKDTCVVTDENKRVLMHGFRQADNGYHWIFNNSDVCNSTREDQTWLWHKKPGHVNLRCIGKAVKNEVVIEIPNIDSKRKFFCGDCQVGKKIKASHKSMKECSKNRVLELLHMNLIGLMQTASLGGKKYVFVVVNDFSRFTWIRFLKGKSNTAKVCMNLCLSLQREQGKNIVRIMSDHGKEFESEELNNFCKAEEIHYEYSTPLTP